MGSKNRIAKDILPFLIADLKEDLWYVEPFVGGCNMIDKINHPLRLGADNNRFLIALIQAVQNGLELPEYITKDEYNAVKNNKKDYPDWYVGFVGFICSFRGVFFSSYVKNGVLKATGKVEDYQKELINNFKKQTLKLDNIKLIYSSYDSLQIPSESIIYCDPPYADTTKYKTGDFDTVCFWDWCRKKVLEGHKVFISEYNAPDDFVCIWEKLINSNLGGKSKKATEKLFIHKTLLKNEQ